MNCGMYVLWSFFICLLTNDHACTQAYSVHSCTYVCLILPSTYTLLSQMYRSLRQKHAFSRCQDSFMHTHRHCDIMRSDSGANFPPHSVYIHIHIHIYVYIHINIYTYIHIYIYYTYFTVKSCTQIS